MLETELRFKFLNINWPKKKNKKKFMIPNMTRTYRSSKMDKAKWEIILFKS